MSLRISCLASALYSSMVREKAVREAESDPRAAGVGVAVREARSRFIDVDCLSALLKEVFWSFGCQLGVS